MKNGAEVSTSVGILKAMNVEQFMALQENLLNDGLWENTDKVLLSMCDGALMVQPQVDGVPLIVMGIEKDGYTHS